MEPNSTKIVTLRSGMDVANEAASLIGRLQSGEVQPITTGTDHLNKALLGGFLPSTILALTGYSFQGKSYEMEKIQRHVSTHYPDVIMLTCAWELEGFKIISRDLAFRTKKTVQEVLFNKPTDAEQPVFREALDRYRRPGNFFQPEPVTSDQFEDDLMWLIEAYPTNRILVAIDNLENILVDAGTQKECMDRMLYRINVLKKRHFFISFVILNQMNNDILKRIDDLKRQVPIPSDMYGTGQLFKVADAVLFKIMPTRFGIEDKFMVFGKTRYPHLDAFKLPSNSKTTSFDPFGKIFYFYLKARETDKTFETVYAEEMYSRADMGLPAADSYQEVPVFSDKKSSKKNSKASAEIPVVPMPEFAGATTPALKNARGE